MGRQDQFLPEVGDLVAVTSMNCGGVLKVNLCFRCSAEDETLYQSIGEIDGNRSMQRFSISTIENSPPYTVNHFGDIFSSVTVRTPCHEYIIGMFVRLYPKEDRKELCTWLDIVLKLSGLKPADKNRIEKILEDEGVCRHN